VNALTALVLVTSEAWAACTCQCVDVKMQPLCSSAIDIPPPCLGICPLSVPSVGIAPLVVPPVGTTSCRPAQVCDRFGNCRVQQVCE
jgi:hypothetical protein